MTEQRQAAPVAAQEVPAACALPSVACELPAVADNSATNGRGWAGPGAQERYRILRDTRSIAILGASANPARASFFVATYLLSSSRYEVFFVNPAADEILGHDVYPTLKDLPVVPDIVDVFRGDEHLLTAADEAIAVGAKTLWLQLGSWNEQAAQRAEAAGLSVVMDRCLKVEHARFHGGLRLAGFDTGVISSRRQLQSR